MNGSGAATRRLSPSRSTRRRSRPARRHALLSFRRSTTVCAAPGAPVCHRRRRADPGCLAACYSRLGAKGKCSAWRHQEDSSLGPTFTPINSISFALRAQTHTPQQYFGTWLDGAGLSQAAWPHNPSAAYLRTCDPRYTAPVRSVGHTLPRSRIFTHGSATTSSAPAAPQAHPSRSVRELWRATPWLIPVLWRDSQARVEQCSCIFSLQAKLSSCRASRHAG